MNPPRPPRAGQSSYAHHLDQAIGQHIVDQFSFHLQRFLTRLPLRRHAAAVADPVPSLQQLLDYIVGQRLSSDVQVRSDLFPRRLAAVPVTEFFGGAAPLHAAAAAVGNSSSGSRGAAAAMAVALLALALERQGNTALQVAAVTRQQPWVAETRQPLGAMLEAAGGSLSLLSASRQPAGAGWGTAAAAWVVALFVAHWLLQSL